MGCTDRGSTNTWPLIVKFLLGNKKVQGGVIFLDEIDKIGDKDGIDSSWNRHLRNEVYRLLDLQVPHGLSLNDEDDEDEPTLKRAEVILQNQTIILAAGAFQHLWERTTKPSLGFNGEVAPSIQTDLTHLVQTLPRELVNRFRSDLVILPQLVASDYWRMLEQAQSAVPKHFRATFMRLGLERIPNAVHCRKGCRFVEELLLDAIIEERRSLHLPDKNTKQEPREQKDNEPDNKPEVQYGDAQ